MCLCAYESALSRLAVEVAAICPANLVHARNYTARGGREDVLHRFKRGGDHQGSDEDLHALLTPAERFREGLNRADRSEKRAPRLGAVDIVLSPPMMLELR